jgi:hypothetical protein
MVRQPAVGVEWATVLRLDKSIHALDIDTT